MCHNATVQPRTTPNATSSPCGYVTGVTALSHRTRHAAAPQGKKAAALRFSEAGGVWGGLGAGRHGTYDAQLRITQF